MAANEIKDSDKQFFEIAGFPFRLMLRDHSLMIGDGFSATFYCAPKQAERRKETSLMHITEVFRQDA